MKYFRITDKLNYNEVIKLELPHSYYQYFFGDEKWVLSPTMLMYMNPDNDVFGMYEEIIEDEAEALLNNQRETYNRLLALAIETAEKFHYGQTDKGGKPYINHPTAVAASLTNTEHKIVAYLHDIVEDTPVTLEDLLDIGFTYRIVNSIRLLTKNKELTYQEYQRRIRFDTTARAVKIADLKHNMDLSRIPQPCKNDYERLEKYKAALSFLESSETGDSEYKRNVRKID